MNEQSRADAISTDATWQQIELLASEIEQLAHSATDADAFHTQLLMRVVGVLDASAGAIWAYDEDLPPRLEHQFNVQAAGLADTLTKQNGHARLIVDVVKSGQATSVDPQSAAGSHESAANPTDYLLLMCPLTAGDAPVGLLEVFQSPVDDERVKRGYVAFLSSICEAATDYYRNTELRDLQQRAARWDKFEQFVARVHAGLDLEAIAYTIAHEGRLLADCDRLSVAIQRGSRARVLAISGVDTINRRANSIRRLESLIDAVLSVDEPLWYADDPESLPPQIATPLGAFLDESGARTVSIVPLKDDSSPRRDGSSKTIGALALERFDVAGDTKSRQAVRALSTHSSLALRNAVAHRSLPLFPLLRAWQKMFGWLHLRHVPAVLLVLAAVAGMGAALVWVPADFYIEGRGELQPEVRRDVFARTDGVVDELHAAHGADITSDEVLAVLRKPELDLEFARVLGELQTAQKRMAVVRASRAVEASGGSRSRGDSDARQRYEQLTADEEELKELLKSLREQHEILKQQRDELTVRSPIDGQIVTWNVDELLKARPVQRGQVLMTVADSDGPWIMEMHVDDDNVGHVLAARKELSPELDVSFVLPARPGMTHRGQIEKVAVSTDLDDNNQPTALVTVRVDRDEISPLRPGTTVVAKILCGRRSLGYVWFHGLIDAVRTRLLF